MDEDIEREQSHLLREAEQQVPHLSSREVEDETDDLSNQFYGVLIGSQGKLKFCEIQLC